MKYLLVLFLFLEIHDIFSQTIVFNNQNEGIEGNLIVNAEEALYSIRFNGIISKAAEDISLLTFTIEYTDAITNNTVTIPYKGIENYNTTTSNIEGISSISGTFTVYAKNNTAILYRVLYASDPISIMKYSIRISIEKL